MEPERMQLIAHIINVQLTKLQLQVRQPSEVETLYQAGMQVAIKAEIEWLKELLTFTRTHDHEEIHKREEILF